MKANRKKGAARPGAQTKNYNVKLKKAKENVFDRMDKGITYSVPAKY